MTKDEFLTSLNQELATTGSYEFNREQIAYYRDYIDTEMAKGRTEQQVMDELGDPRLIAKTIKDANGLDDERPVVSDASYSSSTGSYTDDGSSYSNSGSYSSGRAGSNGGSYTSSGSYTDDGSYAGGSDTGASDDSNRKKPTGMKGFKLVGGAAWLMLLGVCLIVLLLVGVFFSAVGNLFALSPLGWLLILFVVLLFRQRY